MLNEDDGANAYFMLSAGTMFDLSAVISVATRRAWIFKDNCFALISTGKSSPAK
jgi:hypothetical protein